MHKLRLQSNFVIHFVRTISKVVKEVRTFIPILLVVFLIVITENQWHDGDEFGMLLAFICEFLMDLLDFLKNKFIGKAKEREK